MGEFEKGLGLLNQYIEYGDLKHTKKILHELIKTGGILESEFKKILHEFKNIQLSLKLLEDNLKQYEKHRTLPTGKGFQIAIIKNQEDARRFLQKLKNAAHDM